MSMTQRDHQEVDRLISFCDIHGLSFELTYQGKKLDLKVVEPKKNGAVFEKKKMSNVYFEISQMISDIISWSKNK